MKTFAESILEGFPECLLGCAAFCGDKGIVHVSEIRSFNACFSEDDCKPVSNQQLRFV